MPLELLRIAERVGGAGADRQIVRVKVFEGAA